MRRWIGLTLFAVVLWAGAFAISLLVVEWRQETVDVDPFADDIADLKTDVGEIKRRVGGVEPELPTPTTAGEEMVVTAKVGTVVEWRGLRLTIEQLQTNQDAGYVRTVVTVILENVDAQPEATAALKVSEAVGVDGLNCGQAFGEPFPRVGMGQKDRLSIHFPCDDGLKTFRLDGLRLEIPPLE